MSLKTNLKIEILSRKREKKNQMENLELEREYLKFLNSLIVLKEVTRSAGNGARGK